MSKSENESNKIPAGRDFLPQISVTCKDRSTRLYKEVLTREKKKQTPHCETDKCYKNIVMIS